MSKLQKRFHNPIAVHARLRGGAGFHRETRIQDSCHNCGADTLGLYCSDKCELESNESFLDSHEENLDLYDRELREYWDPEL